MIATRYDLKKNSVLSRHLGQTLEPLGNCIEKIVKYIYNLRSIPRIENTQQDHCFQVLRTNYHTPNTCFLSHIFYVSAVTFELLTLALEKTYKKWHDLILKIIKNST